MSKGIKTGADNYDQTPLELVEFRRNAVIIELMRLNFIYFNQVSIPDYYLEILLDYHNYEL
jgi:hypothetical protein